MSYRGIGIKKQPTLTLNLFDDEYVYVHYVGKFDNNKWYSWNTFGPTEGLRPDYDSHIVKESEVLERIKLLEETREEPIDATEILSISMFFGKTVEI